MNPIVISGHPNALKYIFLAITLAVVQPLLAQPSITSFTPASGPIGTSVTINGIFNPNPASNHVYFGAVKATITGASANALTVTVPAGATYHPITVTTNAITAYSAQPFIVTFNGESGFNAGSFAAKIDSATKESPYGIAVGDLDGDGKPDISVTNGGFPYSVSVFRNMSAGGIISFLAKKEFTTDAVPFGITLADVSGDNKLDMVVTNSSSHTVSLFRNSSTSPSIINFANRVNLATGTGPYSVAVRDLNADGKPDIVTANLSANSISLFRNTGSSGFITFADKVDFTTGLNPRDVSVADFDGDGNADVIVSNSGANSLSVFRNTTSGGTFSFDSRQDISLAAAPLKIAVGDLDGDGKPDVAVSIVNAVSILRNTSDGGTVSFAAPLNVQVSGAFALAIADLNGDSKPDIAACNNNLVYILGNTGSVGNLSFAAGASFSAGDTPNDIQLADLDADGRADLSIVNQASNKLSVLKNTVNAPNIASFTPTVGGSGTVITITGTNLNDVTAVTVGNVLASSVTVNSATSVSAMVAGGATGLVSVWSPRGTGTKGSFTFYPPPVISSFSPTSINPDSTLTISGTNFTATTAVTFGGIPARSFTVVSPTTITAVVGIGSSGDVSVSTPGGSANLAGLTVTPIVPTITAFTPASGAAGTIVTITGTTFSSIPSNNIVYFGAAKATITTGTATSLTVTVPEGASYAPIVVTNHNKLSAYSAKPFIVTFPGAGAAFTSRSFAPKIDSVLMSEPNDAALADLDGDGRTDIVLTNNPLSGFGINVYRNIGTNRGQIAFGPRSYIPLPSSNFPSSVALGDLDGDGKPDMVITTIGWNLIRIFKNTSTAGAISFIEQTSYATNERPRIAVIRDLDLDGRPDIAVLAESSQVVDIFRNIGQAGSAEFQLIGSHPTGAQPSNLAVGDLDGDGKPEFIVTNISLISRNFSIYKNTSTRGSISFATKVDYSLAPERPSHVAVADIDGDDKLDIVITSPTPNTVSVFRNTSTNNSISFAPRVDFLGGSREISVSDLDGDGKPDLVMSYGNNITVMKNLSTSGTVLFAAKVDYLAGNGNENNCVGDLDGDSKPDMVVVNVNANMFSVFRNTSNEPTIIGSGRNPVTGPVVNNITIDAAVQTYNGSAYVQRHYDIEPVNNPATATATITLYFTQQEFNNYNSHPAHGLNLPTDPADDLGKANLRVFQYHGSSPTGLPGSYSGSAVVINPDDTKIVWNAMSHFWEITIDVDGFSGFFVGTAGAALPVQLVSFTGKKQTAGNVLHWVTSREVNVSYFQLQRSGNGRDFTTITTIKANSTSSVNRTYQYTDKPTTAPVYYYRLKITDVDSNFIYSNTVVMRSGTEIMLNAYPNPAKKYTIVQHPIANSYVMIRVMDMMGRMIKTQTAHPNATQTRLNIADLAAGSYKIVWTNGETSISHTLLIR